MDGITITMGDATMAEIHSHTQEHQAEMMDEAIAQAFVAARRRLAPEHHSRLIKAWELVVERAVKDNADGSHTVKGVDQPEYLVNPSGCTCTDFTSGRAANRCKHVLAVGLQKRACQRFQAMAERLSRGESQTDLVRANEPQTPLPEALRAGLPEAPISICLKGTLGGVPGTLVTLRGRDMREIEIRADQVRAGARYLAGIFDDTPAASETSTAVVSVPSCPDHGTPMKPSKFGGWYCPQPLGDGESFCQQKVRPAKKRAPFVPPAAYQPGFGG
jgi:hypothetical protein